MTDYIDSYYALLCRSRARQGIKMPPFRWSYLRHWWAWKWYVIGWSNHRRLKREGYYANQYGIKQAKR